MLDLHHDVDVVMRAEVPNQNPVPPYDDYCKVRSRKKYTYSAVDLSSLGGAAPDEIVPVREGVEYEQGWLKQDIAPDVNFGVACKQ